MDAIAGQKGVFNDIWSGLKNDPQGPRIDGNEIIKHLGNQLILCVGKETHPVNLVAISLTNAEAVQAALGNNNNGSEAFRVKKNYLVMGTMERVDRLVTQVVDSPELLAANNLKQIGIAFANFESAYRQLPASKNYREGWLLIPIDLGIVSCAADGDDVLITVFVQVSGH